MMYKPSAPSNPILQNRPVATSAAAEQAPTFASAELMQGHRIIAIEHLGITYRLQATRQGKLILTK